MTVVTDIPLTDDALRDALKQAHLPSLLAALGLFTDAAHDPSLRPHRYRVVDPQGGMDRDQRARVRDLAFDVVRRLRDGEIDAPRTDAAAVDASLAPLLGDDFDAYRELSHEELALAQPDPRAPAWNAATVAPNSTVDVVIVGAGMSGLLAAHRLRQAGVTALVIEKNPDVGGTWFENCYPGCRVDVPSHLYTYSCIEEPGWSDHFAVRDDVHAQFRRFAQDTGVLDAIRFGTSVESAEYDEETARWTVGLVTEQGRETLTADVVVSAVGQLNRPTIPDIPGRDRFRGTQAHSGTWHRDIPVAGRRFAVVGSGASAIQLVTGLLQDGADVTVFQRTPAWLFPTPELRTPIADGQAWLLRNVPTYTRWYRLWLQRAVSDGLLPFADCDPGWEGDLAVSEINDTVRQALTAYIEEQFAEHPDLLAAMLPAYPPFAKRVVRDDGSWARAFTQDGATLVTDAIERIDETGIVTQDGRHHALDGIAWATGFDAADFLAPMQVVGRDGVELRRHWAGDASAYLGMAVPGFPNLFLLYGPNTNIVVNGSAVFFTECQVTYLVDCVRTVLERGVALDVRPEVHDTFLARIDELNGRRAWGCAGVRNWYLSATGRVSQNWPSTILEYWQLTRSVDPEDYHLIPNGKAVHA